jgi:hypothetical protein
MLPSKSAVIGLASGALAGVLLLSASPRALAWGATGHRMIGVLAAESLPADLPAFLHGPATIEALGELAREPDRWRGAGKTHDNMRDPAHFTDVDDEGKVLGGPALNALPATREEFDKALAPLGTSSYHAGYLPYSIVDGWQQLVKDFAYWRIETAAIAREANPAHKTWMEHDLKQREALIVSDLGVWSHYVGDGSQPMHVSVHYNGWGNFPNPNGYTQDKVHGPFEGAYVRDNVKLEAVRAAMPAPRACAAAIDVCTVQYLTATEATVVPFYELQKAGAFAGPTPKGVAFATERVAAGAAEVRDLTAAAWAASAAMPIGHTQPITAADVASGKADAWDDLYGDD